MTALAVHFPDNSGYVVAAYLVFFALLVIYLAITAFRLVKIEGRLSDLTEQLDAAERPAAAPAVPAAEADADAAAAEAVQR
jgi:hypothetical protein